MPLRNRTRSLKYDVHSTDVLRAQVAPALGCTKPAAIALAAAGGDPALRLEVLQPLNQTHVAKAMAAVQAALFSLHGVNVHDTDGIISRSSEDTMRKMGTLASEGMIETDRTILEIMLPTYN